MGGEGMPLYLLSPKLFFSQRIHYGVFCASDDIYCVQQSLDCYSYWKRHEETYRHLIVSSEQLL